MGSGLVPMVIKLERETRIQTTIITRHGLVSETSQTSSHRPGTCRPHQGAATRTRVAGSLQLVTVAPVLFQVVMTSIPT